MGLFQGHTMWPVFEALTILFEAVTLTILVYNDNCGSAPLLQLDWHFRRRLYLYPAWPISDSGDMRVF